VVGIPQPDADGDGLPADSELPVACPSGGKPEGELATVPNATVHTECPSSHHRLAGQRRPCRMRAAVGRDCQVVVAIGITMDTGIADPIDIERAGSKIRRVLAHPVEPPPDTRH